jgi:hypothetical protein
VFDGAEALIRTSLPTVVIASVPPPDGSFAGE